MLRNARVEGVSRDRVVALEEAKVVFRHNQIQEPRHYTSAAVAAHRLDYSRRFNLKKGGSRNDIQRYGSSSAVLRPNGNMVICRHGIQSSP